MTMNLKSLWLPIASDKHTSVLGERCSTATGRRLWAELDFREWYPDDSIPEWTYLHVKCFEDGKVYRVRCWYYPGDKLSGGIVKDVRVAMRDGKLCWLVRVEK